MGPWGLCAFSLSEGCLLSLQRGFLGQEEPGGRVDTSLSLLGLPTCSPSHMPVRTPTPALSGEPSVRGLALGQAGATLLQPLVFGNKFQYIENIITKTLKQEPWDPKSPHSSLLIPSYNISSLCGCTCIKSSGFY